jgi:hypothetical protein
VQVGIDNYGVIENGGRWVAGGGHPQGRKWPIIFAGYMLNDANMLHVGDLSQPPATLALFGEDFQIFYVTQTDINLNHSYYGTKLGDYIQAQLGLPEWGSIHWLMPAGDDATWNGDGYRQCCTANSYVGYLLAALVLGLKDAWHWNAIFDYMDRYWDITTYYAAISGQDWCLSWSGFQKTMWNTYRSQYGCTWVLDTPHDTLSNGHLDCSQCVNNCPQGIANHQPSGSVQPLQVALAPNPMTDQINFTVPVCTRTGEMQLTILNESGNVVCRQNTMSFSGQNQLVWDGKDLKGSKVKPGIYLYVLNIGGHKTAGKIIHM